MPQFTPGESRVAKITLGNPTSKPFNYTAAIHLGAELLEVAEETFSLAAGEERMVDFPVTMPSAPGTYPVWLGVFSGGTNIKTYRATEDITIISNTFDLNYRNPKQGNKNSWDINLSYPAYFNEKISVNVPVGGTLFAVFREAYNLFWYHYQYGPFLLTGLEAGREYTWDARAETLNGQVKENLAYTGEEFVVRGTVTHYNLGPDYVKVRVDEAISGRLAPYFVGTTLKLVDTGVSVSALLSAEAEFTVFIKSVATDYGQDYSYSVKSISNYSAYPDAFYDLDSNAGASYGSGYECKDDFTLAWRGDTQALCDEGYINSAQHWWVAHITSRSGVPLGIVIRKYDSAGRSCYLYFYPSLSTSIGYKLCPGHGVQWWIGPYQQSWPGIGAAEAQGWRKIRDDYIEV